MEAAHALGSAVIAGEVMPSFLIALAASLTAILLGTSGLTHVFRFGAFRAVLRSHGTFPPVLTLPIALLVSVLELTLATSAAWMLVQNEHAWERWIFGLAAVCGAAFAIYLKILLGHPQGITSCGCSPFESPLSPLSVMPALSLAIIASAGCLFAGSTSASTEVFPRFMGVGWGITTALLLMLLPASFQEPARE